MHHPHNWPNLCWLLAWIYSLVSSLTPTIVILVNNLTHLNHFLFSILHFGFSPNRLTSLYCFLQQLSSRPLPHRYIMLNPPPMHDVLAIEPLYITWPFPCKGSFLLHTEEVSVGQAQPQLYSAMYLCSSNTCTTRLYRDPWLYVFIFWWYTIQFNVTAASS